MKPFIQPPLGSVNREEVSFYLLARPTGHDMDRFIRPFNAERDTFYIPQNKWDQFYFEPNERLLPRDEDSVPGVDVVHKAITFALSEAISRDPDEIRCLPGVKNMRFDDRGRLFVIMDMQPERIASTAEHDSWS
ncbi:hypothetical protein E4U19_005462 [Claviceps sp. Clav32 group G5]|nr:hypothetical protein E4U19_005462 [Claviceps sp. Clav32 group G5]KAG6042660.1 hypothetical protein E4U39_005615 [Claviceps sp. Clav50 group G5]